MPQITTDAELKRLLQHSKKIAVIGLSPVPARPSYGVTSYMLRHGYEIYGVRPASPAMILNRPCVESLEALNVDVDLFDVFRNPEAVPDVVKDIEKYLERFPKRAEGRVLWLQEGVGNDAAEEHARELGLRVVSDLCLLKEHARLL